MLSYNHSYHFGNHADILKHLTLTLLLQHLTEKDKAFSVIDTHAGAGLYKYSDERSEKTGEAKNGIEKLLASKDEIPESLKAYIDICNKYREKGLYPGSPEIERCFSRKCDSINLMELHPQEINNLKDNMKSKPLSENYASNVTIHYKDGWEGALTYTPPTPKRGLLITDPSYENAEDYQKAALLFEKVHKKWNVGVLMLWYPLLVHRAAEISQMKEIISNSVEMIIPKAETLCIELSVQDANAHIETSLEDYRKAKAEGENVQSRLYGSGLIIVNSPWKLDEKLKEAIPYIINAIAPDTGSFTINSL